MTTSVRARFAFTVGANLLRSLISFTTGMLLARWLGPASFGQMAFLLGTFLAIRQLLDMGSSTAFFTFMSQRVRTRRFVNAFLAWLALQFLLPLCVVGLLLPVQWIEWIWHTHERGLVLAAFAAVFMQNTLWPVMQRGAESQRRTIAVQTFSVIVVVVHLLAVVLLWIFGVLGLYAIFAAIAVEYLVTAITVRRSFTYAQPQMSMASAADEPALRQYLRYCLPLVPYAWVGFAYEFADRWLLQTFSGEEHQAYYAVSAQWAAVALIATTSILNIFWKEIAEAHFRGDHTRTRMLYQRVSRALFLVGAAIAGYLFHWAEDLLQLILGGAYIAAAPVLAIMLLYPIHQSLGQIGNTMLYAAEHISIQVVVGIAFMILSIVTTYFVLAPADAAVPGLGLGSMGLALKMVVLQIVQVNVLAYIIARLWNWRFDWLHQPVSVVGCVTVGWVAHQLATATVGQSWPIGGTMIFAAGVYLLMMAGLLYLMPWLMGFKRDELMADAIRLLQRTPACRQAKDARP